MIHKKEEALVAAGVDRLLRHMHGFDPSTQSSAAMSAAKADGAFKDRLEAAFRIVVTNFDPAPLVAAALAELDQ